jgi:hypothetical protein
VAPPVDIQDAADTKERTDEALHALAAVPDWAPGDPVRTALVAWNQQAARAAEQLASGDKAGSALTFAHALESSHHAGVLLDSLAAATGEPIPC